MKVVSITLDTITQCFIDRKGRDSMDKQITGFYTVKGENNVIKQIGKMSVFQPKIKYNGKKTKWFDDSKLLKISKDGD